MILQPEEYHSRLKKYAPFMNPHTLALSHWNISDADLHFISDTGNIIFRADTVSGSFCVRIYPDLTKSIPEICGELYWLLDLKRHTNLVVPQPLQTSSNRFVHDLFVPEFDDVFHIVLFHWIPGNIIGAGLDFDTARQLGRLMADLHTHAASFKLPPGSFRDRTDWQGMGHFFSNLSSTKIAYIESFLTLEQLNLCEQAAQRAAAIIDQVDDQLNFGLTHNDLHANNCLSSNGSIGIIDFDDCQFAPFTCDIAITISSFDDFPQQEQLHAAFLQGYSEKRELSPNYVAEIEAFRIERRLRLIRWVATWPRIDHFSSGQHIIENSLNYIKQHV